MICRQFFVKNLMLSFSFRSRNRPSKSEFVFYFHHKNSGYISWKYIFQIHILAAMEKKCIMVMRKYGFCISGSIPWYGFVRWIHILSAILHILFHYWKICIYLSFQICIIKTIFYKYIFAILTQNPYPEFIEISINPYFAKYVSLIRKKP